MIILPTLGRPENLLRFIAACRQTKTSLPIHVVLDANDGHRYNNIITPPTWKKVQVPAETRIGDIFNIIFRAFPHQDYYGMVADDVVPETLHWDVILRDSCLPDKISWGWDGIQNEKLPVHPFIGGDLVRKLGWWSPPGIKHWFVDNAWKSIGVALECENYLPEVKMTHHHYINGKARFDRTYEGQPSHKADEIAYGKFMGSQFPDIIRKIKLNDTHSAEWGSIHSS